MADKRADHPDNHTVSAKMGRLFGKDHEGNNGLSIFAKEWYSNVTCGRSYGDMAFVMGLMAVASVPAGMIGAGFTDMAPPAQQQLAGKFNLINGYSIIQVEGQLLGLIKQDNDRYEVYMIDGRSGDWSLMTSPEQAKQYVEVAIAAYDKVLATEEVEKNSEGQALPRNFTTSHTSVPYVDDADNQIYRESSRFSDAAKRDSETSDEYLTRSRDFWANARASITADHYGFESTDGLLDYNGDYRYWSNARDFGFTSLQLMLAGGVALGGLAAAGHARARVKYGASQRKARRS
jgi:outer membrane lipoprotein-sorting protein